MRLPVYKTPEPRSGRPRRNPAFANRRHANIFQLNGTDLDHTNNPVYTKPGTNNTRGYMDIVDWKPAPFSINTHNFEAKLHRNGGIAGIQVKENGVYFIYVNFVFAAKGGDCSYELVYGDENNGQFQRCRLNENKNATWVEEKEPAPFRPCYLGFAVNIQAGALLKLRFDNWERCSPRLFHFKRVNKHNFIGIIKQS